MHHSELLGKSDEELLRLAPEATHQHYKGGLYRHIGKARDADTGEYVLGKDGFARISYEHVFPYDREPWLRDHTDFHGLVKAGAESRFRKLQR